MKNFKLYKNFIAIVVLALFSVGAIAYADFVRTRGSDDGLFGYGYGYGYSLGFGYGYGYHNDASDPSSKEIYGFLTSPTDNSSATIDSTTPTQTTIAVVYTTTYTATNTVEYGPSYGSSSTPTSEVADSYTVTLTGLTCGTTYNIRVSSEDVGGNTWNDNATTETTSACSSGGGGGGSYAATPATPATPSICAPGHLFNSQNGSPCPDPLASPSICAPGHLFNSQNGSACPQFSPAVPAIPSINSQIFTRNLTLRSRGEDVRALQIYLNTHGFVLAQTGAGSRGNETNYFGPRTRAALARFQAANGINPPAGYFGPITRAFLRQ